MVKSKALRGGSTYVECFGRRDGVRVGGLGRAELINSQGLRVETTEQRRQTVQIDALYRDWVRHRTDVEKLRRLPAAITECLETTPRFG
jgi:hypothetical protein